MRPPPANRRRPFCVLHGPLRSLCPSSLLFGGEVKRAPPIVGGVGVEGRETVGIVTCRLSGGILDGAHLGEQIAQRARTRIEQGSGNWQASKGIDGMELLGAG